MIKPEVSHVNVCPEQVVGGKMSEAGVPCAYITKVKKGSIADVVGHLRAGEQRVTVRDTYKMLVVIVVIIIILLLTGLPEVE